MITLELQLQVISTVRKSNFAIVTAFYMYSITCTLAYLGLVKDYSVNEAQCASYLSITYAQLSTVKAGYVKSVDTNVPFHIDEIIMCMHICW